MSGSTTIGSQAARTAQADPHIQTLLRNRSKVERKIDYLQDLGMRKARYRGRRKTKHQAFLAATVANSCRLDVLDALGQPTPHRPGCLTQRFPGRISIQPPHRRTQTFTAPPERLPPPILSHPPPASMPAPKVGDRGRPGREEVTEPLGLREERSRESRIGQRAQRPGPASTTWPTSGGSATRR